MRLTILTVSILIISGLTAVFTASDSLPHILGAISKALPLIPLVLGAAWVISGGDIDLSPAGMFGASGMIVLWLCSIGVASYLAFLAAFLLAFAVGALHGYLVAFHKVSALVLTLGTSFVLLGIATILAVSLHSRAEKWRFEQISNLSIGKLPNSTKIAPQKPGIKDSPITLTLPRKLQPSVLRNSFPWAISLLGIAMYIRHRTRYGLKHLAVGFDRTAAMLAGLSVERIRFAALCASSLLSFLSATLYMVAYQDGGWNATSGIGMEMTAIAAAVIGGTKITGGVFQPVNAALGIILWGALTRFCLAVPWVAPEQQKLGFGILLVIVAAIDRKRV